MPTLEEVQSGVFTDQIDPVYEQKRALPPEPPAGKSLFRATMERENAVASFIMSETGFDNKPDRGFSLADELRERKMEDLYDRLAWVNNRHRLNIELSRLAREQENEKIIAQAPWYAALPLGVFAGIADPSILLPGGAVVRGARGTWSMSRSAASVGAWAGAGVAAQEAVLQATQENRTAAEGLVNVGAGIMLGGFIGGGLAGLLSKGERAVTGKALGRVFDEIEAAQRGTEFKEPPVARLAEGEVALVKDELKAAGVTDEFGDQLVKSVDGKLSKAEIDELVARVRNEDPNAVLKDVEVMTKPVREETLPGEIRERDMPMFMARRHLDDNTALSLRHEIKAEIDEALAKGETVKLVNKSGEQIVAKQVGEDLFDAAGNPLKGDVLDSKVVFEPGNLINEKVDPTADLTQPSSAGAAATRVPLSRDDFEVRGGAAKFMSKLGRQLFPGLRVSHNPILPFRDIFNRMVGSNIHLEGMAKRSLNPGGAAADRMKTVYTQLYHEGLRAQNANYAAMKKAGVNMPWNDYNTAVGRAMREGDVGTNDWISKGAAIWREKSIVPMFQYAVDVGALDPETAVAGAKSYFPRSHNIDMLRQYRPVLEQRLIPHAEAALTSAYTSQTEKLDKLTQKLEREIRMLKLDEPGRMEELAKLDARVEEILAGYPEEASFEAQLKEVREKLKDKSISPSVKSALQNDRDQLIAALKGSREYQEELRQVQREKKLIDQSFAGQQAKVEKLVDQLEELAADQFRQTGRLVKKGQQFEREKNRWSPEVWAEKRDELKAAFEERERAYDAATVRLEDEEYKLDLERQKLEDAITEAKVKPGGQEVSNFELIKKQQEELAKFTKAIEPIKKRIAAEKKRIEKAKARMANTNARLDAAMNTDEQGIFDAFKTATMEMQEDMANSMMFRGMRAERIKEKIDALDDEVVKKAIADREARIARAREAHVAKWESDTKGGPPIKAWAAGMAREYIDAVSGIKNDMVDDFASYAWPVKVGPLKQRAKWFPESALTEPVPGAGRGFLNDEATHVMNHYLRTMSGDVALRQVFGNISLEPQLAEAKRAFDNMIGLVGKAESVEEIKQIAGDTGIRYAKDLETSRRRALDFLTVQHNKGQEDLRAMRDRILGRYKVQENASNFGRALRAANQLNYMRLMGGVVLASITEVYRPAMVHGLGPFFNHVVKPMITDFEALKMSKKELETFGLLGETLAMHRMHDFAEIADPMASRTGIERLIDNGTSVATRWSGLAAWTDMMQWMAGTATEARVLEGIMQGKENAYLNFLGIDPINRANIKRMFEKYGEVRSGVYVANTDRWLEGLSDGEARQVANAQMALTTAIRKEVDSVVVMQSVGDTPLMASHPLGKALLQFRAYNMSAHQKVMMRGMQEGPGRFTSGLVSMAILGGMVAAAQAFLGGQDRWEKFKKSAENPGFLLGEGLDKSGIFPLFMDIASASDNLTRGVWPGEDGGGTSFNPIKDPLVMMFPQAAQAGDTNRYAVGQGGFNLLGPTANFALKDMWQGIAASRKLAMGYELTKSEKKALQRAMIYGNYLGMNQANRYWQDQ